MPKGQYKRTKEHREKIRQGILRAYREGRKVSYWKGKKRKEVPWWKGGVHKDRGYVMIYMPEHPSATKSHPYIYQHRLVMEKTLGRYLKSNEQVHHINGKRDDNRPENLVVEVVGHRGKIKCPFCKKKFLIR